MIRIASPGPSTRSVAAPAATSATTGSSTGARGDVGGAHRVPVDGAVGERRHLLGGDDIGGQHQPERLVEVDVDRRRRRAAADHKRLGILEWRHTRHGTRR